ncbi:MAG: L,D-transpeptidase family protein [Parasphingorhabdus sp.]
MRTKFSLLIAAFALASCSTANDVVQDERDASETSAKLPTIPAGTKADRILVDKSDRLLILFKDDNEIARYPNIRFGDAPSGHKRFEGDERTPEGTYTIDGRNPGSSYHLSLRVSYPNVADRAYAEARGKSPGGDIFLHGQPNGYVGSPIARDWTDGCIALSNAEIEQIWNVVPDGAQIEIRP